MVLVQKVKRCKDGEVRSMRQRELLEFRTPQHPSLGTNNWGGASPLLARNLPKESLEQKYTKLNSVRTRDEIFPADDAYLNHWSQTHALKHEYSAKKGDSGRGILFKLLFPRREKDIVLGWNSKRRWLPRLNPQNRWPQGWG